MTDEQRSQTGWIGGPKWAVILGRALSLRSVMVTSALERTERAIRSFLEVSAIVLIASMALICFVEVVLRYGFGRSFGWYDEFTGYLLVWLTFLGAVLAQQNGQHIGIENFSQKLAPRYRRWLSFFLHILLVTIHLILLYYGSVLALRFLSERAITLPIPMGAIYIIIPLYGALMLIVLWSQMGRILRGKPGN